MNRRKLIRAALAMLCLPAAACAQGVAGDVDLSASEVGPAPLEFLTTWRTGPGAVGDWQVVADSTATQGKAIAQLSEDPTNDRYPLAVYQLLPAQDVEASVRFKAVSGQVDQAAGLAVRLQDADNYYIARANALEDNVRLYRVVEGDREQLASASVEVSSGEWHTLTLRAEGDQLSVSFNGEKLIDHTDRTFVGVGKVALWTKADSVTHFDQLRITPLKAAAQPTPSE